MPPSEPNSQTYLCSSCQLAKDIPEKPSEAPRSVRTGCERCNAITKHIIAGGGLLPEHLRDESYEPPESGHTGLDGRT